MSKRVSVIVIRQNTVLLVKLKEQDKLLPRATWVFPFMHVLEDESPRKVINDFLTKSGLKYKIAGKVFNYSPSENPKLNYVVYVVDYMGGEPDIGLFFQTYKWVGINDITAYSTSFMDGNVAKYLDEVAKAYENTVV